MNFIIEVSLCFLEGYQLKKARFQCLTKNLIQCHLILSILLKYNNILTTVDASNVCICVSFTNLRHMCTLPPSQHHRSTPAYRLQSGLHSIGPHSHHGGSHYSRAGRLSLSKETPHSSCHPAPLRPVPASGQDSSFHLQRQGQMKETLEQCGKG